MDTDPAQRALDDARRAAGFLTVRQVAALAPEVRVLDPASVLIGVGVSVLPGVELYPSTTLETRHGGVITLAAGARLVRIRDRRRVGGDRAHRRGCRTRPGAGDHRGRRVRRRDRWSGSPDGRVSRRGAGADRRGRAGARAGVRARRRGSRPAATTANPTRTTAAAWSRAPGRSGACAWDSARSLSVGWCTPVDRPVARGSSVSACTTRMRRVVRADCRRPTLSTGHRRAGGQPAPGRAASGRTTRAGRPHGPRGTTG